jgi:hypothetical protein
MPARGEVTPRLLLRLCYDLLQRGPTDAERRSYLGLDVAILVKRLLGSREAKSEWFEEQLYYFLLLDRFRPGGESVDRIPTRLQKGDLDARSATAEILLSTGFSLRNPGNDTFVTVLLEQCLGYRVQDKAVKPILEAGKKAYDGKKTKFLDAAAGSQSDLVQIALAHREFARTLLDRQHRRLLGTPLVDGDATVARVHADFTEFFPVLGEWLQSDTYLQETQRRRPKSERQFLRGLYIDLLERAPDAEELRNLRNAMNAMADPAPLRSVLAKVVLDSPQAKLPLTAAGEERAFVAACFLRYLARAPNDKELDTFTAALLHKGGKPQQIVRALVGSLEYQTY